MKSSPNIQFPYLKDLKLDPNYTLTMDMEIFFISSEWTDMCERITVSRQQCISSYMV